MCGLCGVIDFRNEAPAESAVARMLDAMAPRGPDARSVFHRDRVTLGHLRLKIIDLDDRANQPMHDQRGRTIVFNGEIYNYRELRNELRDRWVFHTESDTEVLLAAYNAWGEECVRRFIGDWAFAIIDPARRQAFLSRDRLGVKPLYYATGGDRFLFASEVKALLAGGVPANVSRRRLLTFVARGEREPGADTMIEGVNALLPGHSMTIGFDGTVSLREYWGEEDIFSAETPAAFDDAVERFGDLFFDAVRLRLRADVPVGVCLSGGIDSSMITAVCSRLLDEPISTFSGVADGYESNEREFSDAVAARCNTRHHRIPLKFDDFLCRLRRFVIAHDAPASGVSTLARMQVLECAAKHVKVVLDGQGGDELQAGYYRYHDLYRAMPDVPELLMQPKWATRKSRYPALSVFSSDVRGDLRPIPRYEPTPSRGVDPITRLQYRNLRGPGLLGLLHTEDRLTMAESLEGRVPFLDHRLVEFCFSAPLHFRIHGVDKRLSREFARRRNLLPNIVIDRLDKLGFASPYAEMIAADLSARLAVHGLIDELTAQMPGIFDRSVLFGILEEHNGKDLNAAGRLIRIITLLMHLIENRCTVVD